jgi:hypothetical protein
MVRSNGWRTLFTFKSLMDVYGKFEKGALRMLPETLRYLSIGDNSFSYGNYFFDLYHLPIHFLNVSNLFKTHDPRVLRTELCDDHQEESRNLNSIAKRTQLTSSGFSICHHTRKGSLPMFPVPPNMTTIIYKDCNLKFEFPPLMWSGNKIQYIDFSNNVFHSWMGPIVPLDNLEYLDLSNNICTNISKVFFLTCQNVRTLLVKNNAMLLKFRPSSWWSSHGSVLSTLGSCVWNKKDELRQCTGK